MRCSAWLVLLATALWMGGCAGSGDLPALTQDDNGKTVEMKVGQTLTVTLPANRTTGYAWAPTGDVTGVLALEGPASYHSKTQSRRAVGAGGTTTWTYRAISPGTAQIRMDYRRAFEDDIPPAKRFEAEVNVTQ